jgi:ABC-type dipeptide/oligopeptide/nickel transport system ATPase component
MLKSLVRALRLPFITASILPFVFGSLIERTAFGYTGFCLGFLAVISVHLSANLINDYADSASGADAHDLRFFGFFGGSKLIQENVFSPTVREDIVFGPLQLGIEHNEIKKRLDNLIEILNIKDLVDRQPHQLSVGEKKKISIASVLVSEPEVLLLDEPTAGLDPATC